MNKLLKEFLKNNKISRAIYWNKKAGHFCERAYSSTVIAMKTNDEFIKFKAEHLTA